MEEVTRFASYQEYKAAFDAETERVKTGFVRIGYLLRVAEDTDILKESGYTTMEEFAWKEYHIDASQASRFKNINKRFSEGGYSDRLQERFRGYGVAKLGELLTLSDEIIETLPPELTRNEIKEVKREVAEEEKVTDLEVMLEEPEGEGSNLEKWLDAYFRDNPKEFIQINDIYLQVNKTDAIMDLLAPSGIAAKMARIKGSGKFLLAIKSKEQPIELLNIRTNEKETYSFDDCWKAMKEICPHSINPKEIYAYRYQQPFPEEEKIAPVQPEKSVPEAPGSANKYWDKPEQKEQKTAEKVRETGKSQKTTSLVPKKANKTWDKPEEKTSEIAPVQLGTENLEEEPRQAEIEDYPEVLPEGYIKCHDGSEVKESPWEEAERLTTEVYQIFAGKDQGRLRKAADILARISEIVKEMENDN